MHLFRLALLAVLLTACSTKGPIHEPTKLQPIANEVKVSSLWHAAVFLSSPEEVYTQLQMGLWDSTLYTITSKGKLRAYALESGKKLWSRDLDTIISAGIGVSDDLLLLGTDKGDVIALTRADGTPRWQAKVSSEVLAPPVVSGNMVIVRSSDGVTTALNAGSGEHVWQYSSQMPPLSLRGDATPVVAGDRVLLGEANGHLVSLSLFDGVVQWESTIVVSQGRTDLERMVDVDATPLVAGDVIYVAAYHGRVMALSGLTGTMIWSRDLGASVALAIDEQNLYVVDDDGQVWALDRDNGSTIWMQDKLKYRDLSAPVVYDNVVVVADFEGYLHWLSKVDGKLVARYQIDEEGIQTAPLVVNDVVYTHGKTGKLEAVKLKKQP